MNKAVLISIRPKLCELIASGKKTIEVRKTRPKLETPFKCYIYCTASNVHECLVQNDGGVKLISALNYKTALPVGGNIANGKVIGEFVCNVIANYEAELWDDETFERIQELYEPEDFWEHGEYERQTIADSEDEFWEDNMLCKASCLTIEEFRKYLGGGFVEFYGWHISDLVVYDRPKELDSFRYTEETVWRRVQGKGWINKSDMDTTVKRPPQSWCYVEEMEGADG